MARTTITLPDSLVKRLEPHKHHINVSQVCAIALENRVAHEEPMVEVRAMMKNGCPVIWASGNLGVTIGGVTYGP